MRTCEACSRHVDEKFRFCPHCGAPLRVKVVEHFAPAPGLGDAWLRVSAYLQHPQHVRFSIWLDGEAQAATSLAPAEVDRLAEFLRVPLRLEMAASLRRGAQAFRSRVRELVS